MDIQVVIRRSSDLDLEKLSQAVIKPAVTTEFLADWGAVPTSLNPEESSSHTFLS